MFVLVVMRFVGVFAAIGRCRLCRHRKTRMAQVIENTTTKTVGTRMCGKSAVEISGQWPFLQLPWQHDWPSEHSSFRVHCWPRQLFPWTHLPLQHDWLKEQPESSEHRWPRQLFPLRQSEWQHVWLTEQSASVEHCSLRQLDAFTHFFPQQLWYLEQCESRLQDPPRQLFPWTHLRSQHDWLKEQSESSEHHWPRQLFPLRQSERQHASSYEQSASVEHGSLRQFGAFTHFFLQQLWDLEQVKLRVQPKQSERGSHRPLQQTNFGFLSQKSPHWPRMVTVKNEKVTMTNNARFVVEEKRATKPAPAAAMTWAKKRSCEFLSSTTPCSVTTPFKCCSQNAELIC